MPRDSPDLDFRHDWQEFVKGFLPRKFDRFSHDDARDGPGAYLGLAIEAIRKGDPYILIDKIQENSMDFASDSEYSAYQEAVKEFAKEWENPTDIETGMQDYAYFRDDFNEIYEERERFNWEIFFGDETILVWNTKDAIHTGWMGDPRESHIEAKKNPELKKWVEKAIQFVGDKQIGNIINNGFDYDVTMFIGGLLGVQEVIKAMMDGTPTPFHTGDVVVGAYDGLNGAGFFEHGITKWRMDVVFGDKNNPVHIDWGSYSLGDIFGTRDWVWH